MDSNPVGRILKAAVLLAFVLPAANSHETGAKGSRILGADPDF